MTFVMCSVLYGLIFLNNYVGDNFYDVYKKIKLRLFPSFAHL